MGPMDTQFVRFVRGTPAAWQNLTNKKDNTLYFICAPGAATGQLYLGSTLISGNASESSLGSIITANVTNKDLLVYDAAKQAWVNKPITEAIATFVGATSTSDGSAGLVPAPTSADVNKFLRGDGQWVSVTNASLANSIDTNEFTISNNKLYLIGFETAPADSVLKKNSSGTLEWVASENIVDLTEVNGAISQLQTDIEDVYTKSQVDELLSNISGLSRTIVDSIDDIDVNAAGALNHIYLIPNDNADLTNNNYSEYLVVKNKDDSVSLEKVGDWGVDLDGYVKTADLEDYVKTDVLDNYVTIENLTQEVNNQLSAVLGAELGENETLSDIFVTVSTYNAEVGDLSQLLARQVEGNEETTLVDQVNTLTELLSWQSISE